MTYLPTKQEWDHTKSKLLHVEYLLKDIHKQLDKAGLPVFHTDPDNIFSEGERLKARLKILLEERQEPKELKNKLMRVRQLYAEIYTTLSEAKVLTANTPSMFLVGEQLLFSLIKGEIDPADSEVQEKPQKGQGAALHNSTPAEREALHHIYGFLKHHGLIGKWENSSAHIAEAVKKVLNQWHELQFKKIVGEDDVSTLRNSLDQRNQILRDIATQCGVVFFGDLPNRVRVMQEKLQMIGALITK